MSPKVSGHSSSRASTWRSARAVEPGARSGGHGGQDLLDLFRRPVVRQIASGHGTDSTMAEFISNSAILPAISPGALLADAPWTGLERHKWQSLASIRPSHGRQHWDCRGGHRTPRHPNLAQLDHNADWAGPIMRRMARTVRRFAIRTDGSVSLKRRLFTARNASLNEIRGCKPSSPGRAQ